MIESVERLFGISYGRFFLRYEYAGKNGQDPYGFGIHVDIDADSTMPGGMFPWQRWNRSLHDPTYKPAYRWAYLTVQFGDDEPIRLRPEQTLKLLKQRPHHELCTLLINDFRSIGDMPEEIIARAPEQLERMEFAYRLKKYKGGKLELIPLK